MLFLRKKELDIACPTMLPLFCAVIKSSFIWINGMPFGPKTIWFICIVLICKVFLTNLTRILFSWSHHFTFSYVLSFYFLPELCNFWYARFCRLSGYSIFQFCFFLFIESTSTFLTLLLHVCVNIRFCSFQSPIATLPHPHSSLHSFLYKSNFSFNPKIAQGKRVKTVQKI